MSDLKYVLHKNSFARLIPDYNKKPKFLLSGREHLIFGRVLLSLLEDVENKNDKVFKECLNELDFSNISLEDSIVEDDVSELDSSLLLTSFEENKEEELDEMPDISVVPKIDQHTKMVKQYKNMLYHLLRIHYLITSNIEKTSLVNALKKSVDKFFITFNLLFPGYNYSIKYHNLLHYHEMIENVDFNVRNALTINFESTHQRLKRNIAHSHNNMNVYFSSLKLSTMSYLLSSKDDSYKEYDYLKHKFKLNL
uniref:GLTP domain-containing protein n=1 Tax=Strongyloides papillosus TaxID=174720 RepID=A0A0N5C954_STREA